MFRTSKTYPSAVIILKVGRSHEVLHIVPETHATERLSYYSANTDFKMNGSKEGSRQTLGSVTLHVGDHESAAFLTEVKDIALASVKSKAFGSDTTSDLTAAAIQAMTNHQNKKASQNATQKYEVLLAHINRPKATSIASGHNPSSLS